MPEQSLLPGFSAPPELTSRLFFAIFPDADAAEHIASAAMQLRTTAGLNGKPLQTARFHLTLHHLGDYPELRQDIVAMAMQAAAAVSQSSFHLEFDRAESFDSQGSNKPFVLQGGAGLAKLRTFQQALSTAMQKVGLAKLNHGTFTPHVTLLYDQQTAPATPISPISWVAREFVLVHSLIGQTKHVRLGTWPLHDETA